MGLATATSSNFPAIAFASALLNRTECRKTAGSDARWLLLRTANWGLRKAEDWDSPEGLRLRPLPCTASGHSQRADPAPEAFAAAAGVEACPAVASRRWPDPPEDLQS